MQVETIAGQVQGDTSTQVLALICDTTESRVWARDMLAVKSFPCVMGLPADEASVYRLTERGRTPERLINFMNTVFRRQGDRRLMYETAAVANAIKNTASKEVVQGSARTPSMVMRSHELRKDNLHRSVQCYAIHRNLYFRKVSSADLSPSLSVF
jgi:hypothetical protein